LIIPPHILKRYPHGIPLLDKERIRVVFAVIRVAKIDFAKQRKQRIFNLVKAPVNQYRHSFVKTNRNADNN
jgi:hypothetical protein